MFDVWVYIINIKTQKKKKKNVTYVGTLYQGCTIYVIFFFFTFTEFSSTP